MQAVIKIAVMLVFVGYVFIWVMLPTDLYQKDWLLKIRAETMSTYLGTQGLYDHIIYALCPFHYFTLFSLLAF